MSFCRCSREQPTPVGCGINGIVETYDNNPNNFKIIIEDASDASIQYVAISGKNGEFSFRDIDSGTYSIEAEKDGYRWIWMNDDGEINHSNRIINLMDGQIKNLKILMGTNSSSGTFDLELTDIFGNPITNSVHIPKYSTTVSFRLINKSGQSHSWGIDDRYCIVYGDRGAYEYIFSYFNQKSGTLNPGDNVLIVGTINQEIFNIYTSAPSSVFNQLNFTCGFGHKEVLLDIDF